MAQQREVAPEVLLHRLLAGLRRPPGVLLPMGVRLGRKVLRVLARAARR
jgi:hypothetical protein